MRFALRNKTKLINAFGEAYYNELIASINSFQSNYTPDCHYWNEAIQKEMLDMPSSTHPDKTFFVCHCERNVGCDNACLLFSK